MMKMCHQFADEFQPGISAAAAVSVIVINSHVEQSPDSFSAQCIYCCSKRGLFKRFHLQNVNEIVNASLCAPLGTAMPHHAFLLNVFV